MRSVEHGVNTRTSVHHQYGTNLGSTERAHCVAIVGDVGRVEGRRFRHRRGLA
jgi:hypothetical protein